MITPWLKNTEANIIPPYGCVLMTGISEGAITVKRPDTFGCQYNAFLNGPESIDSTDEPDSNYLGQAQCGSPMIAAYDSANTPAVGEVWGPRSGSYLIQKNTGGFRILGIVDSTNHYVLVVPAPMLNFRGKTDASHAKSATGTISIYAGTLGSETDTTVNMSGVYNRFGDVDSGKWVTCNWDWDNLGWELISAEC